MKKIILPVFLFFAISGFAQELQKAYSDAMTAYKAKNYSLFYDKIKEANKIHPYHQGVLYQLGIACALTNKKTEAIKYLTQAILINSEFRLEGLADFNSIKDSNEYKKLLALQKELQQPIIHSDTAFLLKDRSLHTEGIEYDAAHKTFYFGSIHQRKIIKVINGKAADFCSPGFQGMTSLFGLKADVKKNTLWVCSSPMQEMENYDSTARSAAFQFELSSGKLIHKYVALANAKGVFGDLILSRKGTVYISDSQNNNIVIVNEKTKQIEPFFSSVDFWNIQGMAFSTDDKYLFIADYVKGIFRLDMKTKALTEVKAPDDVSLKGIDGIYFYKNSLITIQNGVIPLRSTRYYLTSDLDRITRSEIIDRNHPAFGEPTLGVLDGDTFYYIANSQWGGYDDNHHIKPKEQLKDIVILKNTLK
jgi:sugar lactone lactonase YvrE